MSTNVGERPIRGLNNLTYPKDQLAERITTNRDAHREVYEQAMSGYRRAARDFFEEQLTRAERGRPFVTYFNEPIPEDHTADYDALLDQLELTPEDQVTLSTNEFRQYVRDEWGWKKEFMTTAENYLR
jgi:hypothetical protein